MGRPSEEFFADSCKRISHSKTRAILTSHQASAPTPPPSSRLLVASDSFSQPFSDTELQAMELDLTSYHSPTASLARRFGILERNLQLLNTAISTSISLPLKRKMFPQVTRLACALLDAKRMQVELAIKAEEYDGLGKGFVEEMCKAGREFDDVIGGCWRERRLEGRVG